MGLNVENQLRGKVNGVNGANGNGIASIVKTGTSGLVDTYTINFTDGNTETFTVTNGAKGDTGDTGNGISSVQLNNDYTLTINFTNGESYTTTSIRGQQGEKGDKPTKGVDYFTNEEVEEFKDDIVNGANSDFNANVTEKMTAFNSNATSKTNTFNNNATAKTNAFNTNAADKTDTFDSNASTKTSAFNSNATSKTSDFDTNATNKTTTYNQNATTKTSEYNTNAQTKLEAYNTNATAKMTAYNENAEEKIEEYNDNASELMESVEALETKHDTEVAELQEQLDMTADLIPTGDATGSDITINDSARYWFKKMVPGGKSEQETFTGKNKVIPLMQTFKKSGITVTFDNEGRFTAKGTLERSFSEPITMPSDYSSFLGKQMTLSRGYTTTGTDGAIVSRFEDKDGEQLGSNVFNITSGSSTSYTTTIAGDTYDISNGIYLICKLYFPVDSIGKEINISGYLQLEEGSIATDYEPYTGGQPAPNPSYECPIQNVTGDVEVKVENKNLFTGWIIGSRFNSNTGELEISTNFSRSDYIKANLNEEYYFSNIPDTDNSYLLAYDKDKNFVARTGSTKRNSVLVRKAIFNTTGTTGTGDLDSIEYIAIVYSNTNVSNNTQLEEGSTATDYAPHEEQTAIFPLSEGQILHEGDTIEDKIVQKRKTIVFDGTENWNLFFSTQGIFTRSLPNTAVNSASTKNVISNYFIGTNRNYIRNNLATADNLISCFGAELTIANKSITTAADFKAWVAEKYANGTPLTVEYELAEPIETEFTETQVTAKAQIDKLYSYKGTTYITSEANLDVTYRKDLETMFDKMEELDARLSLLES